MGNDGCIQLKLNSKMTFQASHLDTKNNLSKLFYLPSRSSLIKSSKCSGLRYSITSLPFPFAEG